VHGCSRYNCSEFNRYRLVDLSYYTNTKFLEWMLPKDINYLLSIFTPQQCLWNILMLNYPLSLHAQAAYYIYNSYKEYESLWNNKHFAQLDTIVHENNLLQCRMDILSKKNSSLSNQLTQVVNKNKTLSKQYEERISKLEEFKTTYSDTVCDDIICLHERIDSIESKYREITAHEFTKRVEIVPIYDYEAIRIRNRALNLDFQRTYRIFSRLLDIRYNLPMAIAVVSK